MLGIFLFLFFGYMTMKFSYPFHFAGAFVGLSAVLSLIFGQSFLSVLFISVIFYAYTCFIYYFVDRYGDYIFKPVAILVAGAFIWFGAAFVV